MAIKCVSIQNVSWLITKDHFILWYCSWFFHYVCSCWDEQMIGLLWIAKLVWCILGLYTFISKRFRWWFSSYYRTSTSKEIVNYTSISLQCILLSHCLIDIEVESKKIFETVPTIEANIAYFKFVLYAMINKIIGQIIHHILHSFHPIFVHINNLLLELEWYTLKHKI